MNQLKFSCFWFTEPAARQEEATRIDGTEETTRKETPTTTAKKIWCYVLTRTCRPVVMCCGEKTTGRDGITRLRVAKGAGVELVSRIIGRMQRGGDVHGH